MILLKSAALGLALMTLAGGGAFAQSGSMMKSEGAMAAQPMKMSAADMKTMKTCKAMSSDKMMKNKACAKMAKAHPDMMKSDAMMKNDSMMKSDGAMSSDAMKTH